MKSKFIIIIYALLILGIAAVGCSDIESDITSNESVGVHPDGFGKPGSDVFHSAWFKVNNWELRECQTCHAADYSGGVTGESCLTCHTGDNGPESCNTCHGDFGDSDYIAPPQDLSDNTSTTAVGVGSHTSHIYMNSLMTRISCFECHENQTPEGVRFVYGHIAGDGGTISFGEFASSGLSAPEYSYADNTCSNTYCHGNFELLKADSEFQFAYTADKMEGNNFTPRFNQVDDTQGACGTCHGLPPTGHIPSEINNCTNCHFGVVDAQGKIIDKTLHINGQVNVYGSK
ncbi:MAG: cytochrome c3 family protein [Melioribacteraceae bacterium]|nr:cytochrome c3 family protein [Melioribacteraceae bacterium]MDD3559017.1 cytochrome c3 family protein [Melioribacteraceae bacterium]